MAPIPYKMAQQSSRYGTTSMHAQAFLEVSGSIDKRTSFWLLDREEYSTTDNYTLAHLFISVLNRQRKKYVAKGLMPEEMLIR